MEGNRTTDRTPQPAQQQAATSTVSPQRLSGGQPTPASQNNASLSSQQQDLLLAALHSQADYKQETLALADKIKKHQDPSAQTAAMDGAGLFMSPQQAELDAFNPDYTPDLDYLDGDSFDFDNADLGGEMIGALPASGGEAADIHEKRKSPDEKDPDDGADHKRQETQEGEKGAKKPGRKPLTSEPTTVSPMSHIRLRAGTDPQFQKRKAQNRAAQRAFRERKEKHLKDLETKVQELTKAQEADKHENGLLKAQVERLQIELREYRKRLSLNSSSGGLRASPPLTAYTGQNRNKSGSGYGNNNNNFQFEFPKFGALPGSQIFGNQQSYSNNSGVLQRESVTPPISHSPNGIGAMPAQAPSHPRREDSSSARMSPKTVTSPNNATNTNSPSTLSNALPSVGFSNANNMHGFASTLPQMGGDNPFGDLFSPSILRSASTDGSNYFGDRQPNKTGHSSFDAASGGDTTAGLNRVFQFNSASSASDSASPSGSSNWNNGGANSSCGTSPEPSHDSPANKLDKTFTQPSKLANQQSADNYNVMMTGNHTLDFNVPSTDTFDPVLFGDYRDNSQNTMFGNDFNTGFFDNALNQGPYDFGSPSNLFGILQSPQQTHTTVSANSGATNAPTPSRNLMAEIDKTRDGGDEDFGLPKANPEQRKLAQTQPMKKDSNGKLISCNNIWYVIAPSSPFPNLPLTSRRNQLQSNPDFQAGTFDLDSLCSELRQKARCSESGVMVDQDHVDQALKKLGQKDDKGKFMNTTVPKDMPSLMFEQESWDNVLKKLGGGS
jgi:AP-1-like transcription factor